MLCNIQQQPRGLLFWLWVRMHLALFWAAAFL